MGERTTVTQFVFSAIYWGDTVALFTTKTGPFEYKPSRYILFNRSHRIIGNRPKQFIDGRNPANHLGCIKLVNSGTTYLSTGAGFLPSAV